MHLFIVAAPILIFLSVIGFANSQIPPTPPLPRLPVQANAPNRTNATAVVPPAGGAVAAPPVTIPPPPVTLTMPTITKIDVIESMPRAKVCSSDSKFCLTVTDLGEAIDIMAEFPGEAKWGAVGWGTAMPQSDIVLGYVSPVSRKFIVSDRKATGRTPAPLDPQQDALAVRGGANVMPGKWLMEFQRKKDTGDANDAVVDLSKPVSMIWAYHATTPAKVPTSGENADFRATITKHTGTGALTLDMQDEAQIEAAKKAGLSGVADIRSSTPDMPLTKAFSTLATVLFMSAILFAV